MRRADRLFRIVQMLRGGRVVTAARIAREFEVSARTIYRDVQDLLASGVPIDGEAGVGYCLRREIDLPPLMFDEDEIGALVLGARMVEAWGDSVLAQRARSVLSKVESVLPARTRPLIAAQGVFVPMRLPKDIRINVERFRRGINKRLKVRFRYQDEAGKTSRRTVRPLCLAFWGRDWTASAWCELRNAFRNFRPDRMRDLEVLDEPFLDEPGKSLDDLLAQYRDNNRG